LVWKLIEPFAAYGFNKAHAASYGRVAYQTAYMKANFPAVYMCAVLTAESGNIETIAETIAECKRMDIPVLPPDINESVGGFTVIKHFQTASKSEINTAGDAIRFGMYTIKNVGEGIADTIIAERQAHGAFSSLADFLNRIKDRNLNRKSLEALIKAGAFDQLSLHAQQAQNPEKCERGQLLGNIDDLLAFNKEAGNSGRAEDSLFGLMSDASSVPTLRLKPAAVANPTEKLTWEKDLLGLYVSGHPLDKHQEKLAKQEMTIAKLKDMPEGATVVAYGILEEVKIFQTKKGDKMLFIKVADYTGTIEGVVFPKTLKEYPELFVPEACIALKGRLSKRNDAPSIVVEKAKAL
jgi:DNA polymerase-3 subunit alpha